MILEIASLSIKEGQNAEFEKVIPKAIGIISQSKGFISIGFQHCIESPSKYLALIRWETLEDHTVGFREGDLFTQWRAILSPFFEKPPFADHYYTVI